jgi:hypothetical protein
MEIGTRREMKIKRRRRGKMKTRGRRERVNSN